MAFSVSSIFTFPGQKLHHSVLQFTNSNSGNPSFNWNLSTKCESKESSSSETSLPAKITKLDIGSPIVVTEAPKMIKTAASMPCLRVNSGIVSRKPKDVWAVRLSIGTYLIDGKYFKPLELDE
ncbi:protein CHLORORESPIRATORY REDUCTION 42, chloroplastic isoform X2 [Hevea brasiliensis]|uniref:protein CHLORORESPIRATORY REDUCTION 42, chloroplastic isoform X2 n=1 Tax=Hevea brasiliensis TaxID=3981 RepID=UPI0025EA579A|nr:protein CHLORORESPIRATORY REDUCTION 42, chloroplastic isoform X2 [Hevea brasiliensis]